MKLEIKATEIKKSSNGQTAAPKVFFTEGQMCVPVSFVTVTTEHVYMVPSPCTDNILSSNDVLSAIDTVKGFCCDITTTAKLTRTTMDEKGNMNTGKGKIATESAHAFYAMLTAKGKGSKTDRETARDILNKWSDSCAAARERAAADAVNGAMDTVDPAALAAAVLNNPELMAAIRAQL